MSESSLLTTQAGRPIQSLSFGVPLMVLLLLGMMTLPVPTILLDLAFTFNIALALVVLLVSVYALRPLDFAIFPTVLLVATLLRLGLNIASTRVVLLEGHAGGAAAGRVIEAFGDVLVGGNYVVGLVVFIILVIINFVVVTKGAGRISEVSARFTLDAMPGKQMAIDADLNAGLIDQDAARERREDVSREADFYGAMDGASKFVRGDAVAGILILLINIIGGFTIGILQHELSAGQSLEAYTLLTIGDGLVAQIPSLLLSTATAIMVSRVSSKQDMSQQVNEQLFSDYRVLSVVAGILIVLGLIPGMPHLVFLSIGGFCAYQARVSYVAAKTRAELPVVVDTSSTEETEDIGWQDVVPVDPLGLEVGYRLISLVDRDQDGSLLSRIRGVRKKLSAELGFLLPSVHVRDNLDLTPNGYRLTLMGVTVGEAEIHADKFLAIDPGEVFGSVKGIATKDPAFGLDALWIEAADRDTAQTLGYTVVDASTVVATHLNQIMQKHAAELLGHDEVQQLIDMLSESAPKLAEQLVPNSVTLTELLRVLQNLLRESVPIRDIRTIAVALAEAALQSKDISAMTACVRKALARLIVQSIFGASESLSVITLDPELEALLTKTVAQTEGQAPPLEPSMAERLQRAIAATAEEQEIAGRPAVILCARPVRDTLAQFVRYGRHQVHVLSYDEVPENRQITVVATIGGKD